MPRRRAGRGASPRDPEQFGRLRLVAAGAVERRGQELALHGFHETRLAAGAGVLLEPVFRELAQAVGIRGRVGGSGERRRAFHGPHEVVALNGKASREDEHPAQAVFQLAHVPRPRVAAEQPTASRDSAGFGSPAPRHAPEERLGQYRDVVGAVTKRHLQRDHVQAMVKIGSEQALRDGLFEIAVRRREDAHVHAHGLGAADALERPLLQHAQDLGLDPERNVTDLVEQDRAAVGALEHAHASRVGSRERAALEAEQLAFEKCLGNRGAVHGDHRALGSPAVLADHPGHQLLTRPRLASDQDSGLGRRDAADGTEQLLHPGAVADDQVVGERRLVRGVRRLAGEPGRIERLLDRRQHRPGLEWLHPVVERAQLRRLDRDVHRAGPGHHDHGCLRRSRLDVLERLEPFSPGSHTSSITTSWLSRSSISSADSPDVALATV
jgi:hypothetical protein